MKLTRAAYKISHITTAYTIIILTNEPQICMLVAAAVRVLNRASRIRHQEADT